MSHRSVGLWGGACFSEILTKQRRWYSDIPILTENENHVRHTGPQTAVPKGGMDAKPVVFLVRPRVLYVDHFSVRKLINLVPNIPHPFKFSAKNLKNLCFK